MTAAEKFCLQWNEFQTNAKTSYRGARKTEDFADVTLACENGQQIRAHRIILSSSSLFFRDLLASLPHAHPLVYMRGLKHQDLSNIIDFIYHGEAEVLKEDLETFLSIAGELRVKGMNKQTKKQQHVTKEMIEEKLLEDSEPPEEPPGTLTSKEDTTDRRRGPGPPIGEVKEHFDCDQCGKTYGTKASLRTHVYNHSKKLQTEGAVEAVKEIKFEDSDNTIVREAFKGVVASPDTTLGDNVELEEKFVDDSEPPEKPHRVLTTDEEVREVKDYFDCDQCGKSYGTKASLRTHVYNHSKKLQTVEASVGVVALPDTIMEDNVELEKRIDSLVEKKDGIWNCIQCGKSDSTRFQIRRHAEIHLEGFIHPCLKCDHTSKTRGAFDAHKHAKHPEVKAPKPFNCDTCGKPSGSIAAVRIHKIRNHTNLV